MTYASLRYFNVAGAHANGDIGEAHNPETHLIPIVLQAAAGKREHISVYGRDYNTHDGTCVRDYIHVVDLCEAHLCALDYLRRGGTSDIFNLGCGAGYTVDEIIAASRKYTGREIKAVDADRRAGDPDSLIASSEKAQSILGWKPKYESLEDIITSAWKWHSENPNGYLKGNE
jgi:UDP-glucose 4-epimerase